MSKLYLAARYDVPVSASPEIQIEGRDVSLARSILPSKDLPDCSNQSSRADVCASRSARMCRDGRASVVRQSRHLAAQVGPIFDAMRRRSTQSRGTPDEPCALGLPVNV